MEHLISLAPRRCSKRPARVGQAVRLDKALGRGQDMAVLVELQSVLRRVGQRVERRGPHGLGSEMVLMLHRWRELLVLVETGRHHPSSAGLGLDCTTRQGRIGLNGDGGGKKVAG